MTGKYLSKPLVFHGARTGCRQSRWLRRRWQIRQIAAGEEFLVGLSLARRTLVAARPLVALDQADQHGVDQDIVRGVLLGERLGEGETGGAADAGRRRIGPRRLGADPARGSNAGLMVIMA